MMIWKYMGMSENVVYPIVPNGFHDHYPYEKWLFHWGYTPFSDKPTWEYMGILEDSSNGDGPDTETAQRRCLGNHGKPLSELPLENAIRKYIIN